MEILDWLLIIPLGLLAGGLAGLLGIGGGLIFAPLLLWMGLSPHQALATSTFAIVPTAMSGTATHLRARSVPARAGLAIGIAAFLTALIFSRLGRLAAGWHLLALQACLYLFLACTIQSHPQDSDSDRYQPFSVPGLTAVGGLAGFAGGLLGLGGGLVMVPLMVRGLSVPIRLAIRFSTVAVACSTSAASLQFLHEGRGLPTLGLILGGVAAVGAQWSASRLDDVKADRLAWMLRGLAILLAFDSARRAIQLVIES
ncbi:MAG: hypothetical protein CMN98_06670 [Synechococcus sp. NP17]|jgi:uncharacterized membrane protein YfcA|nr:hypothetical protein [Synechococcus sp. NP17]|tara:strand:+ start:3003 stop:3770 length:768 start_codon:yes stop_codon:yes gene_type:complete